MKRLITILLFLSSFVLNLHAQEFWIHSTEDEWNSAKRLVGMNYAIEILNTQTTNAIVTTNGTEYVTNYVHTASNTNNLLWQMNFSLTNSAGDNVWLFGYTVQKCGGFPVAEKWSALETWIDMPQQSDWGCGFDMGLVEYMAQESLGWRTNAWLTLSIPFVDDNRKVQKRQSQYKKEK